MNLYAIFEEVGSEYDTSAITYLSLDYSKIKKKYDSIKFTNPYLLSFKALAVVDIEKENCITSCFCEEDTLGNWIILEKEGEKIY